MLSEQLVNGLKNFFKEEQLSDRILQIIEIDENFGAGTKRKNVVNNVAHSDGLPLKRYKINYEAVTDSSDEQPCCSRDVSSETWTDDVENSSKSISQSDTDHDVTKPNNVELDILDETEVCNESMLLPLSNGNLKNEICYAKFPIHSIVLCINSSFFKKLLVESGMKETTMKTVCVKVNQGEGKYLEKLIEAFYNQDVLKDVLLTDLLCILDIAARFSCLTFIKHGIDTLNEKQISSVKECDSILQHISRIFEVFDNEGKYESIKNSCLKYLAKQFYPLEFKLTEQDEFKTLNHVTLMYLLSSNHAFTIHENNTMVFVYIWLLHNKEFQTANVIELLLTSIRYEALTVSVLCDQLTVTDHIFSIWPGYAEWLVNALKYYSYTPSHRNQRSIQNNPITIRFVTSVNSALMAKKHFVFEQENKVFCDRSKNFIVWGGLQLYLLPSIREFEGNHFIRFKLLCMSVFSPGANFKNFHQKFEIYYCLLPGNVVFNESMLESKRFSQRYVRKSDVQFKCKCSHNFHIIAKIDNDFLPSIEQYGINMVMFFKNSPYSWNKMEMFSVKTAKKLITLKADELLSEF